eukprot:CAMPEP_0177603366 /NCGR_PEP_ID=MMETSP0419_2-20121207/15470_1 /TAXON_ID=582737 /ORGANISM="Tetraselmis sp., Strain GSL018" /LENGTH=248 /DNA_ID=CAMNT_0019097125 /DNA_START=126 /DNA_END=872 /DNA_ORIENTATION=+
MACKLSNSKVHLFSRTSFSLQSVRADRKHFVFHRALGIRSRNYCDTISVKASANNNFDFKKAKETYESVTSSIPPVATAATVPVIGLSLLCKLLTGSGLPGTFLGTVEGISYLVFIAGCGSFLPRASAIVRGRDFSTETVLAILNDNKRYGGDDDVLGNSATQRLSNLSKTANKSSAFSQQMADLEKARRERAAETPEQRAMKEKLKKELAAKALKTGKTISMTGEASSPQAAKAPAKEETTPNGSAN